MPSQQRSTIAVDMDEVIADALGEHILRYNRDFPNSLTLDDLRDGRRLWQVIPADRHTILDAYLLEADFFRVLRVMPDAQRVLQRLQSRYEVFIASAAMEVPTSFAPKYDWLAEHFPFIPTSNIVFCGNKSILRADYLIDDNPRQLALFQNTHHDSIHDTGTAAPVREGILYTSPANINVTNYRRANNWQDIEKIFLS
jgi:5'(3')-deoxyribonucleotidase